MARKKFSRRETEERKELSIKVEEAIADKISFGIGRPMPDEKARVEIMASQGVSDHDIAAIIREGSPVKKFVKLFEAELKRGRAKASAAIVQKLHEKAMGGDTTALMYWTRAQLGWSEKTQLFIGKTENYVGNADDKRIADKWLRNG